ncbi:jg7669 [Pararge aegeria aegeria]|uniref:Jg7669 protein n=1 Tax=Pararge aegeria aegeria TaxID=348720 RepID=A0A8S4QKW3_9NEOP|nr:jg7669 [Pararge aegeria aegeria]
MVQQRERYGLLQTIMMGRTAEHRVYPLSEFWKVKEVLATKSTGVDRIKTVGELFCVAMDRVKFKRLAADLQHYK